MFSPLKIDPVYAWLRARARQALAAPSGCAAADPELAELPLWLATSAPESRLGEAARLAARLGRALPSCAAPAARARVQLAARLARRRRARLRAALPIAAALCVIASGASFAPAPALPRRDVEALTPPPATPPAAIPRPVSDPMIGEPGEYESGLASWYGPGFHGHVAADGTIYDQEAHTAAHRTLPLGTRVRVRRRLRGGEERTVVLTITDRGPYADTDRRVIDLSHAAARELGVLDSGVAWVEIEVLARPARNLLHYRNGKPAGR